MKHAHPASLLNTHRKQMISQLIKGKAPFFLTRHAELFELLVKGNVRIVRTNGSEKKFSIDEETCRFSRDTLVLITSKTGPAIAPPPDEDEEYDE